MTRFMTFYYLLVCAVLVTLLLLSSCDRLVRGGVTGAQATAAQVEHERMWNEWVEAQP